ncbi:DUF3298 and DUF4163 domain-containing protein [Alkaliphilus transvaalensis]|uniref:DUF3298 and DUF4163 domain-containing protein n=1 Tax=Alkaliphilus transvaalensis TaxID=114628 RepID=UPI00047ACB3E|nr:DUF3298 and DUF4163 domain-containing protein [Alkaliphilus transvaalensis]
MNFVKHPAQIMTKRIVAHNLTVNYPAVVGLPNPWVEQKINYHIYALVHKLIVDTGYFQYPSTTVDGWYEIKTNERGILSLTIAVYHYPYRAAHGTTVVKGLTFNIETGKSYDLKDLFKPDSDYVKVISENVAAQIKRRDIPLLGDFPGIAPDQDYYIADKSLVIFFQLYEITPYVYGIPFFPISVYDLQDIIREGSPLDLMAINY